MPVEMDDKILENLGGVMLTFGKILPEHDNYISLNEEEWRDIVTGIEDEEDKNLVKLLAIKKGYFVKKYQDGYYYDITPKGIQVATDIFNMMKTMTGIKAALVDVRANMRSIMK